MPGLVKNSNQPFSRDSGKDKRPPILKDIRIVVILYETEGEKRKIATEKTNVEREILL